MSTGSVAGSYAALVPLAVASGWAILVLVAEMFTSGRRHAGTGWLSIVGLVAIAVVAAISEPGSTFADAVALDGLTIFATVLLCLAGAIAVLMAIDHLPETQVRGGEYYPLVLFTVVGGIFMAAATDLIVLFVALETMSMALYVLAGLAKPERRSNEAALKYFLLGAFAAAFMVYGIALVYAAAGSTRLAAVAAAAPAGGPLFMLGVALLLVGLGFKVAAVPFHLWTPDVYEGAPTSVTALMATVVKAAAFAALVRFAAAAVEPAGVPLVALLWAAAAATMTVGNVVALKQTSLKRMLAYSSIAHTGYLLVGVTAGTPAGAAAVLYYLTVYAAMNLGAFGIMMLLARSDDHAEDIRDLAGLARRRPMLAVAMAVCMLSLIGIPPLGGFFGKLYLFLAALERGYVALVVIAALNSVVSAVYYLGVVRTMYFDEGGLDQVAGRGHLAVATSVAVVLTVVLGLAPSGVVEHAASAVRHLVLGP